MALTNLDRELLRRCLAKQPGAWNDFVDRFLGLIYHVVQHTAHLRSTPLTLRTYCSAAAAISSSDAGPSARRRVLIDRHMSLR